MICPGCRVEFTPKDPRQLFCGKRCRQWAFRLRKRCPTPHVLGEGQGGVDVPLQPLRLAYADPPYPGLAARYYAKEASFGGEVDHAALIEKLQTNYDAWALSTSSKALQQVLGLCPKDVRVCPWIKPIGTPPATRGPHNQWEPLIVAGGRRLRPGFKDWLRAQPARFGGTLMGRKPLAFCAFLFEQLGALPGDSFDDLFPGTGIVGRAWAEFNRGASLTARAASDR